MAALCQPVCLDSHMIDPETFAKEVGARIADVRRQNGLSQAQLAERAGFSQQMIGDYETGRRRIPACNLAAIADALGVPAVELFANGGATPRKRGPASKIERLTDQIAGLPRSRQRFVVEMIENALKAS